MRPLDGKSIVARFPGEIASCGIESTSKDDWDLVASSGIATTRGGIGEDERSLRGEEAWTSAQSCQ